MDLWIVLTIFTGALGAIGLASFFVPGVAQYIVGFFTMFVNLLRQSVQFVIDHSPRPLKIVLFIGLFALVGGWTYQLTYGASYVCSGPNEVSEVGYFQGLALTLFPTTDPWEDKKLVDSEIDNQTITPAPTTSISQPNGSTLLYKESGVTWLGKEYEVAYALMPRTEFLLGLSTSKFFAVEDEVIWSGWFGDDTVVRYDLCLDTTTNTCVLERGYISSAPCIPRSLDAFGTLSNYPWKQPVGRINYYLSSDYELSARFDSGTNFFTDALSGIGKSPSDCSVISRSDLEDILDGTSDRQYSPERIDVYAEVLDGQFGYKTMNVVDEDVIFDDEIVVTMYDVSYTAVAKLQTQNQTVQTAFSTLNEQTGEIKDTRRCTGGDTSECDVYQLLGDTVPVKFSSNAAFKVVCNEETDDPFDTKPLLMGIDILNWKIMAMFVVIGAMLSLYMWFKNL